MYFLNDKGELLQGEPLTNEQKGMYDDLKALFHEKVCGGYHPSYSPKCEFLAVYFVQHFNIEPKGELSFAGLTEEAAEENAPKFIVEVPAPPQPAPVQPTPVAPEDEEIPL
jgi:hypothetical protein